MDPRRSTVIFHYSDDSAIEQINVVVRKGDVIRELSRSFALISAMYAKKNPTPVASNPRGLYSDRFAYQKYIHSVYEAEQEKKNNQPAKGCNKGKLEKLTEMSKTNDREQKRPNKSSTTKNGCVLSKNTTGIINNRSNSNSSSKTGNKKILILKLVSYCTFTH